LKFEKFVFVFALICYIVNTNNKSCLHNILRKIRNIKNYNNIFNLENAFIFSEHNNKNYNIDLLFDKKSFYKLLYSLFEKELDILQNYLLKNLILNRICKSINFVNILILFVLKSNNNLKLYINYCNFNIIIIKNRYSLSLIKKTLNYLIDTIYFIKLNLKNTYYRIYICKKDK